MNNTDPRTGTRPASSPALANLVAVSRRYGADPEWVLAGGGNTSLKTADRLFIKASGFALATIGENGFCEIDRTKLDAMWRKVYPTESKAREAAVLADLFAARVPGEEKRPSVETLLHSLFPQTYVVHTHPALINGLTCGVNGEHVFNRLFSDEAIWVPFIEPGYTLAKAVALKFDAFVAEKGFAPRFMLMQNHGFLVAADTVEEIDRISIAVVHRLRKFMEEQSGSNWRSDALGSTRGPFEPDFSACTVDALALMGATAAIQGGADPEPYILHSASRAVLGFAADSSAFAPLAGAFSPDHIVYAGHEFLRVDSVGDLDGAIADYKRRNGTSPRIVLVRDLGVFAIGKASSGSATAATRAMELFLDACKIATYSAAFGGALHMTAQAVEFIRTWEVEQYRAKVAAKG